MVGKLLFVGLGLTDDKDITIKGLEAVKECDFVFAESYTSLISKTTIEKLEKRIEKKIILLRREDVEGEKIILEKAKEEKVALLTAGDPMVATTHVSLRLAAIDKGILTGIIHNASIITAAAGACGLQHYKFGRTTNISFSTEKYKQTSSYEVLAQNNKIDLHTLILLDLNPEDDRFMTANEGMNVLLKIERDQKKGVFTGDTLICVLVRVGSDNSSVCAGKVKNLIGESFGPGLHSMIVPGKLHFIEEEALKKICGMKD